MSTECPKFHTRCIQILVSSSVCCGSFSSWKENLGKQSGPSVQQNKRKPLQKNQKTVLIQSYFYQTPEGLGKKNNFIPKIEISVTGGYQIQQLSQYHQEVLSWLQPTTTFRHRCSKSCWAKMSGDIAQAGAAHLYQVCNMCLVTQNGSRELSLRLWHNHRYSGYGRAAGETSLGPVPKVKVAQEDLVVAKNMAPKPIRYVG